MDFKIAGKKALVCAASKGIGKAVAQALAAEGVELFLCARDQDVLSATAKDIEAACGRKVHFQTCDLSDEASANSLIEAVMKTFNGIDILIHNVGGPPSTTALETRLDDYKSGFNQLFASVARLNEAFLPGMQERKWGRIITVTSLAVIEPIATLAISNAMRSAVTAMSKTLADQVASSNICVNCVAPGLILTDRTEDRVKALVAKGGSREEHMADYVKAVPAGRLGTPEEFAACVAFLCSQQASYITGSTICVDGGKRRSTY